MKLTMHDVYIWDCTTKPEEYRLDHLGRDMGVDNIKATYEVGFPYGIDPNDTHADLWFVSRSVMR